MIIRFLDIIFSALALIVLSPFLILIALILRFTGEGEIFYIQDRVGINGKIFGIFKYATMLKDSPNMGAKTITERNDPRVLPFGSFLRKTKINELPQLWNVLNGSMSIIGPRPVTQREFDTYSAQDKARICSVSPGLSGVGSIVFSNEESLLPEGDNPFEFYKRLIGPFKSELESWFIDNRSTLNYFVLIFLTVLTILRPDPNRIWTWFPDLPKPCSELADLLASESTDRSNSS